MKLSSIVKSVSSSAEAGQRLAGSVVEFRLRQAGPLAEGFDSVAGILAGPQLTNLPDLVEAPCSEGYVTARELSLAGSLASGAASGASAACTQ